MLIESIYQFCAWGVMFALRQLIKDHDRREAVVEKAIALVNEVQAFLKDVDALE